MEVTDLVMLDTDPTRHKKLTNWDNSNIIEMARWLSDNGKDMWIRRVLVPGFTDDPEELKSLIGFIGSLKTVKRVEILPYHTLRLFKWEKPGIPYPFVAAALRQRKI